MQTKTITLPQYKHMFWILSATAFLSLVVYVYAINQTVRNIIVRQQIQAELSTLTSHIGEMEFAYISSQNSIDITKAHQMGFKDVATNIYINRDASVAFADGISIPR